MAHKLALTRPESGAWLHALPLSRRGTLLDNTSPRVTITSRLALYILTTCNKAGSAVNTAEENKRRKYNNIIDHHDFIPFAVETLGPFGDEANSLRQSKDTIVTEMSYQMSLMHKELYELINQGVSDVEILSDENDDWRSDLGNVPVVSPEDTSPEFDSNTETTELGVTPLGDDGEDCDVTVPDTPRSNTVKTRVFSYMERRILNVQRTTIPTTSCKLDYKGGKPSRETRKSSEVF
ncbi:hypothetical protein ILUMI_19953 [Ignelater luminosus]|uniref:Uncharacterized protein n=1 Tax=Ignelater luminosus TaxID=2038154 RepID=A0A8K0CF68_IGNLU|nr:hypothetical protein ILUMI_19953 [Ignelater luminosus]